MSKIPSGLSAREVDHHLKEAVAEFRRSEQRAVLWFAEVLHRSLFRDLGFGSIQQYAEIALGFGPAKTAQFVRLSRAFRELPRLRMAVARGDLTWTQARTVAGVATPETEAAWLTAAKDTSSRGLEEQVRLARQQQARTAAAGRGQARLTLERGSGEGNGVGVEGTARGRRGLDGNGSGGGSGSDDDDDDGNGCGSGDVAQLAERLTADQVGGDGKNSETRPEIPPPVPPVGSLPLPRHIQLRFSPEQGARYDALLEAARKQGVRGGREDLLLGALELLVATGVDRRVERRDPGGGKVGGSGLCRAKAADDPRESPGRSPGRIFASPYQVLVQLCPSCAGGSVVTGRGAEPLPPQELRAVLCDARVRRRGKRNRAGVPARVRREVLERDGHRCRSAGCGSARFLAVHHRTPRAAGGTNDPENLLTLCASCHRAVHGHAGRPGQGGATSRTSMDGTSTRGSPGRTSTAGRSTRGSVPGTGAIGDPSGRAAEATRKARGTEAAEATEGVGATGGPGPVGLAGAGVVPLSDRGG